jgi:hypothetical protein
MKEAPDKWYSPFRAETSKAQALFMSGTVFHLEERNMAQ